MTTARVWALLVLGAVLVAGVLLVFQGLHFSAPLHVSINGEDVFSGGGLDGLPAVFHLGLAFVIVLALLAALVVVPIALVMAMTALLLAMLGLIGLPLLAVLAVLVLLLSPLWLIGWLAGRALSS